MQHLNPDPNATGNGRFYYTYVEKTARWRLKRFYDIRH